MKVVPILGVNMPYILSNLLILVLFYYGLGFHHKIKRILRIPVYEYSSSMKDFLTKQAIFITKEMKESIHEMRGSLIPEKTLDHGSVLRTETNIPRRSSVSSKILDCFQLNQDGTIQENVEKTKILFNETKKTEKKRRTILRDSYNAQSSFGEPLLLDFEYPDNQESPYFGNQESLSYKNTYKDMMQHLSAK